MIQINQQMIIYVEILIFSMIFGWQVRKLVGRMLYSMNRGLAGGNMWQFAIEQVSETIPNSLGLFSKLFESKSTYSLSQCIVPPLTDYTTGGGGTPIVQLIIVYLL